MKTKIKKALKKTRVIVLLFFVVLALVSIFSLNPSNWTADGVVIRSVAFNSTAANAGFETPAQTLSPLDREIIHSVNGDKIHNIADFYESIHSLGENRIVSIQTDRSIYSLHTPNSTDEFDIGLIVEEVPKTNLRKGLDLAGGTRVLLEPVEKVSDDDMQLIVDNLQERLNVYGLSDVLITQAADLQGNSFILVEIAGATQEEVADLLSKQGKFEAKIGNETVFFAGGDDIPYVCRSADCSGINAQRGCSATGEGYVCSFFFSITLSPEAAQRQADLTDKLDIVLDNGQRYLSKDLSLLLDDVEVDSLRIGAELKGRATTSIQISGSGAGITESDAVNNALLDMKKLQTIIVTGSLPVKLEIVKMDTISSSLGKEFLNNIIFVALMAILSVIVIVFARYRKLTVVIPMVATIISEIILILGFASLFKWQLDLAAIAGIIIVAGTGVDHLIVITDETLRGEKLHSIKQRIKAAMFIVFGAYLTTVAGMIPLLWAGAGLLKGFALTTIAGITFGVFLARPAFAAIIEELLKDEE